MREREQNPIKGIKGGILAIEMGLGKTAIAFAWLQSHIVSKECHLVICCKSMMNTWIKEHAKLFSSVYSMFLLHPEYLPKERNLHNFQIEWLTSSQCVITSYETIVQMWKNRERNNTFFQYPFARIVCDESQRFISTKSAIFGALQSLKPSSGARFCLTGTPVRTKEKDLESQLTFCGLFLQNQKWRSTSFEDFGLHPAIFTCSHFEANISLPTKEYHMLTVAFDRKERSKYDNQESQLRNALLRFARKEIKFTSVLQEFNRLRELCSLPFLLHNTVHNTSDDIHNTYTVPTLDISLDPIQDTDDPIEITHDPAENAYISSKVRVMNDILREIPMGEKSVVFSSFPEVVRHGFNMCQQANSQCLFLHSSLTISKREKVLEKFQNDPQCRFLFLTTGIGSIGLHLTAANHLVLLDVGWSPTILNQTISRVWRLGQMKPVHIWSLQMTDSIDVRMWVLSQMDNCDSSNFILDGLT